MNTSDSASKGLRWSAVAVNGFLLFFGFMLALIAILMKAQYMTICVKVEHVAEQYKKMDESDMSEKQLKDMKEFLKARAQLKESYDDLNTKLLIVGHLTFAVGLVGSSLCCCLKTTCLVLFLVLLSMLLILEIYLVVEVWLFECIKKQTKQPLNICRIQNR